MPLFPDVSRAMELFFELSPDLLCLIDYEGRFLRVSTSWTAFLGYEPDALIDAPLLDFCHSDDSAATLLALERLRGGERVIDFSHRFRKANGDFVWLSWNAASSPDRTLLIGAAHDLSAQMETIHRLERAREEAERAYQAKSRFISTISHELRTPLNAVLGYAALLEDLDRNPKTSSYLRAIQGAGKALRDLINDILDLSRAESGKLALNPEPTDPRNLLAELAEVFRFEVERKGIALSLSASAAVPSTLLIDPVRFKQVALNLTGNAVKFTAAGAVTVSLDAIADRPLEGCDDERSCFAADVILRVEDTGIGMTEEYRNRLFEPFSQQDSNIARSYGGTGLGLSIAKRIMDLMKADIACESKLGAGTTFTITIPRVTAAGRAGGFSLWIGSSKSGSAS